MGQAGRNQRTNANYIYVAKEIITGDYYNNNNKTCGKVFGFLEIFRTYMKGDHKLNMKAPGNGTVDFLYYSHCGT